jgi:hypothetical protein
LQDQPNRDGGENGGAHKSELGDVFSRVGTEVLKY